MEWKFHKGIPKEIISQFENSYIVEEKELGYEHLIQDIQQYNFFDRDLFLLEYINYNIQDYQEYYKQMYGQDFVVPKTNIAMQSYLFQKKLENDFQNFIQKNKTKLNNHKSQQELINQYIESLSESVFRDSRYMEVFIYRERDRKGILISKNNFKAIL